MEIHLRSLILRWGASSCEDPFCGHEYTIRIVDKFEGEEGPVTGRVNHGTHKIELSSELPKSQLEEVFLHEVGHCLLYHGGHESDQRVRAKIERENTLDVFANGLYNLGVGEFLLKKARKGSQ